MFWFSLYPVLHKFPLTHNKNIRLRVVGLCYIMQTRERNEENGDRSHVPVISSALGKEPSNLQRARKRTRLLAVYKNVWFRSISAKHVPHAIGQNLCRQKLLPEN